MLLEFVLPTNSNDNKSYTEDNSQYTVIIDC